MAEEKMSSLDKQLKLIECIEKLQKLVDVQSGLLEARHKILEITGLYAKQKFRENGLIRPEPCLWCETPPGQEVTEEQRQHVLKKYQLNIEFEGFHCADHKQLLHDLIGDETPLWSCCKLPDPAEDETAAMTPPE